ncbi:hypothetical protein GQ55_3G274400 [Panicum hallii var. hallii]|uniref:Uncharacterized protein n=1 Tax=Panicum hallii var. hallii TaxID=1504633 RepID=A0A2T7EDX9_9POAL|nr:hypothetical protein GQ55_3G274400 [Panicum hallii var. hallii]
MGRRRIGESGESEGDWRYSSGHSGGCFCVQCRSRGAIRATIPISQHENTKPSCSPCRRAPFCLPRSLALLHDVSMARGARAPPGLHFTPSLCAMAPVSSPPRQSQGEQAAASQASDGTAEYELCTQIIVV